MDIDEVLLTAEDSMERAVQYLKNELRGMRTGRANTALVEYVKVDYYGSPTDLRQLALISVQDASQIVIKPFDQTSAQAISKAIQNAGLGLNPTSDGKNIRISIPALSGERRQQLITSIKKMGEDAKVTVRNARRDANKQIDKLQKDSDSHVSEDQAERAKNDVQELLKKFESQIEESVEHKSKEIQDT